MTDDAPSRAAEAARLTLACPSSESLPKRDAVPMTEAEEVLRIVGDPKSAEVVIAIPATRLSTEP
jgi:hypothetical protein